MGQYNHKEHKQVIIQKKLKEELDALSDDIYLSYHIPKRRDVTYSKVIQCLMAVPAENIRAKASGVQELVTSILFNGSGKSNSSDGGIQVIGAAAVEHAR